MSFLPTTPEEFQIPSKSSQFMKFEQGENEFRILSKCYEGYLIFTEESKPIRKRIKRDEEGKVLKGSEFSKEELIHHKARKDKKNKDMFETPKYFWMFLVYNYATKEFQVLEVSQKGVITTMMEYLKKEDWADPKTYNYIITKSGNSLDTNYTVTTSIPKSLPKEVLDTLESLEYDIDKVFDGGYPFD
jgi:hypothetical protein